MITPLDKDRRGLLGAVAMGFAAAGSAIGTAPASAQGSPQGALARALPPGFGPLKQIRAGVLDIGYAEAGPSSGPPVVLLHGWPYDIHTYVDVAPLLASTGYRGVVPCLRGYGATRFLSDQSVRNGQQSALAADTIALMDALGIQRAVVAGCDWGARTACIVGALWPERCKALVSVSGYLIGSQAANKAPLPPEAELAWWYQFYFATERGQSGYEKHRKEFAKLIWRTASPKWGFDEATFDRSAAAFDNPDHVAIVIHNYRWRLGLAEGEAKYTELEKRLAESPAIAVPTITLEGDANGAPHPDPRAYAKKFSGKYEHRFIEGGIGHNLPQEAPQAFAAAVVDVAAGS
ncbi:MAG TPA: alpha/beta hydrolase [Acetobacteraceae bacterium]|nr:alpha/beta hydrolase [Acetobacteraceae bacterium]